MISIYDVAITLVRGVGYKTVKLFLSHFESTEAIFKASEKDLLKINGIGLNAVKQLKSFDGFNDAKQIIETAKTTNTQLIPISSKDFPQRLKIIEDSPSLLYYQGNANLHPEKSINIVGTRNATSYGYDFLDEFIPSLKTLNLTVVSGLAYGIDVYAHKLCLKHNIPTIGVMANGIDRIYPSVHKDIALQMKKNGGLLTENTFGARPDAPKFPARNRIIAGLSDATIVVEATAKGGAMITAEIANQYNKDVFALPGDYKKPQSVGCNNLIKQHKAHLISSVKDLCYIMRWEEGQSTSSPKHKLDLTKLTEQEISIVNSLVQYKELSLDRLAMQTQIPVNKLASILLTMEFSDLIKPLTGNCYKLNL